ncbi:hypothetical protein V7O62_01290 [Methanolobus sp. ZRKC2]|uniref:hypothetical protein n=1 Tax=Methanolobus sp. ZRKC2 TaxID=3125783 RepID=UPI0032568F23
MYLTAYFLSSRRVAELMLTFFVVLLLIPAASADMFPHESIQLTNGSNNDHPSWSPDGNRLVFASDQAIWSMNPDGSGRKRVYDGLAWEGEPVYNHDGDKIYYASESKNAFSARYISVHSMDVDGANVLKLTETADARGPSVSPDGTQIAYVSRIAGNYDVWVMDVDGSNNVRITDSPGDEASPSWSPDGSSLLYSLDGAIFVQGIESVKPVELLNNSYDNVEPVYSPDGKMIAFSSNQGGDYDLWLMDDDGKSFSMLTSAESNERAPSWSPDGNKIAYVSNEGGDYNIWLMTFDSGIVELEGVVEQNTDSRQNQLNPFVEKIRIFATEDPRTFIVSVLVISFLIVTFIVYSFLRKIH